MILIVFIARTLRHTSHTQADAGVGDGGVCVGVVVTFWRMVGLFTGEPQAESWTNPKGKRASVAPAVFVCHSLRHAPIIAGKVQLYVSANPALASAELRSR